ncbi:D-glycerate dehydrogenase [Paraconexibacter antarcticus]|uniref:D-glycerate dehydrogenase n=1 Tax=Paraconexibacter antarcticus TaxID=2949664 RepID=A0ABY5DN13_9ACTN|nr:NAD(P)-dependent oxidoreductase [Paraconexibacter antarcticus]UTI63393.1 D-glycerate dehydrogenase [Paraconexibacter antarcticus]
MARVLVTRPLPFPALDRLAAAGHDVHVRGGALPPSPAELRALAAGADGILSLLTDRVDRELLVAAPRLRVVANFAVGCDNIDLAACAERGVAVGVTPDVLTEATADLAFALLLAAARRLAEGERAVREGDWRTWEPAGWLGADVHGRTLVIAGAGRIGAAVARRAAGFDMRVITVGRTGDLHAALAEADFISLHTPLTPATRHLVDAAALAACRPGAILVNTARGGVVDQVALADALRSGHLAAAALDVTDPEPLPPDDPLLSAPNLLVVPHIGSATRGARERMATLAVGNLLAGLAGSPLPHPA